jgi:hypothetical protein
MARLEQYLALPILNLLLGAPNWLVYRSESLGEAIIPVGTQTRISNTSGLFHVGLINGGTCFWLPIWLFFKFC